MSFANCRGSQAAKPRAAVAGPRLSRRRAGWICFGTRQTRQLVPAGPGGTGSWEGRGGMFKGRLAKRPPGGGGREPSMKFPPNMQLILT